MRKLFEIMRLGAFYGAFVPALGYGDFGSVGPELEFLTKSSVYQSQHKTYPLSYYIGDPSDSKNYGNYIGSYLCDFLKQNCAVTLTVYDYPFAVLGSNDNPMAKKLQVERTDMAYGTDIYDAATWQLALAVSNYNGLVPKNMNQDDLWNMINTQNDRLNIAGNRGTGEGFQYGNEEIVDSTEQAFAFRMFGPAFFNLDPLVFSDAHRKYVFNDDKADQWLIDNTDDIVQGMEPFWYKKLHDLADHLYVSSWSDWKPITGENAWAFFIGPIQSAAMQYDNQGYIPADNTALQNAIKVVPTYLRMQSGVGGIYYAPLGTEGNTGEAVTQGEISLENNFSTYAGLHILEYELTKTLNLDPSADKSELQLALHQIQVLIHGGEISLDGQTRQTNGLLAFFKDFAFDVNRFSFITSGLAPNRKNTTVWNAYNNPEDIQAVDVNTWGIAALSPKLVDQWYGKGSSYKIWQSTKELGGYYGPTQRKQGTIWGVGFSNKDQRQIMSAEWSAGAINMLRTMINYYETNPTELLPQTLDSKSPQDIIAELKVEQESMLTHIKGLQTDNYPNANFNGHLSEKFQVKLPPGQRAYLYASKRYSIPFGWYANPIPSTTSTSWIIMLKYGFNPFQPGAYHKLSKI